MNRRNFFQTIFAAIFAAICAIFLPKSKKAESKLVVIDDQSFTFGQDDDYVFVYQPGAIAAFHWCGKCDCFHTKGHHPKENHNG